MKPSFKKLLLPGLTLTLLLATAVWWRPANDAPTPSPAGAPADVSRAVAMPEPVDTRPVWADESATRVAQPWPRPETDDAYIKRARVVALPVEWLAAAPATRELTAELFPDARAAIEFDTVNVDATRFVGVGRIAGVAGSEVIVASRAGVVAATIVWPGKGSFEIRHAGAGQHRVIEIDPNQVPVCGADDRLRVTLDAFAGGEPAASGPSAGAAADGGEVAGATTTLDVMVVYTAQARIGAGGTTAINTVIDLSEAQTNLGYANSGVDAAIKVVHREELAYTEAGSMFTDLDRLTAKTDGFMDNVHALRDTHAADLVVLLTQTAEPGLAGLAWVMCNVGPAFEAFGFSVTRQQFATQQVFSHELGHNLGCAHDHDNKGTCQAFNYSFGHRFTASDNNLYRTVMAYAPGAAISHFSNPNVNYLGTATGVAGTGPTAADNARTINQTILVAADFRQGVDTPSGPTAPSALVATAASASVINLGWNDNSANETGFQIERSLTGTGGWALIATVGANVVSDSNTNLSPSTKYFYRVRAFNADGNSAYSNLANATTLAPPDTTPPTIPTWVTVTPLSTSELQVSWQWSFDSGSGVAGYRVYRDGQEIANNVTGLLHRVSGLAPETVACFQVAAFDNAGNISARSAEVCGATLPAPPPAPLNLAALPVTKSRARVSWINPATNELGVDVERSLSLSGPWIHFATTGPDSTVVTDYGLFQGLTYYYRARAFNLGGASPYSAPASLTTGLSLDVTPPTAPGNVALTEVADGLQLDWSPAADSESGVAGYRILLKGKLHGSTTQTTYKVVGLAGGREHCLTVVAFDFAGNQSAPSNVVCGRMPAYESPVGDWEISIKGAASGLALLTLAADATFEGHGLLAEVCGAIMVTGVWAQVGAEQVAADFVIVRPDCPEQAVETGQFAGSYKQGIRLKGVATTPGGTVKWSGQRLTDVPDVTGFWMSQSKTMLAGKIAEALELEPVGGATGLFAVTGGAANENYELSGRLMVSSQNRLVAILQRLVGGAEPVSYYTGKVDVIGGLLKAKGQSDTGHGEQLNAERE